MKLALGLDVQTNAKGGKFMSIEDSHQGALVCKVDVEVLWEPGNFPVPGRPVSSRELPARQWLIGSSTPFHLRCLGRSASMRGARLLPSNGFVSDGRAVRVAQRLQRPQPLREALRQPCVSKQSVFTCAK